MVLLEEPPNSLFFSLANVSNEDIPEGPVLTYAKRCLQVLYGRLRWIWGNQGQIIR